jgi:tetratricopeptide (TPR) repeat protein
LGDLRKGRGAKALTRLAELHQELGPDSTDPVAPDVAYMLAFGYWAMGEEEKATALARHGYRTHPEPFGRGRWARMLGMCELTQSHLDDGIRHFEDALELMEEGRPLSWETTEHALDLAALYRDTQRWDEVTVLLEKVLAGYRHGEASARIDNFDVFQVRWSLAIAYWHTGAYDAARDQLVTFRGYEPLFARHPWLRQSVGQAGAIVNYLDSHPQGVGSGEVSLEDIVGVVRDDWRYQGLLYKSPLPGRGWGGGSGRSG